MLGKHLRMHTEDHTLLVSTYSLVIKHFKLLQVKTAVLILQ